MNYDTVEVVAIIAVPDVGEYRYVGRSNGGPESAHRIAEALKRITLSAEERLRPYSYGANMYGDHRYSEAASLRKSTFEVVDRETFEGEIYENSGTCGQNDDTTRRMRDQTARKLASICDVFRDYGGVYVRDWSFTHVGNGVPAVERPYLEN